MSLDDAIKTLNDGENTEAFEQTLTENFKAGENPNKAIKAARVTTRQTDQAEEDAGDNVVSTLATGKKLDETLGEDGGDKEGFEKALSEKLQAGENPDKAVQSAQKTVKQATKAQADAGDNVATALASGKNIEKNTRQRWARSTGF